MWLKNLCIQRVSRNWCSPRISDEKLATTLNATAFRECGDLEVESQGWGSSADGQLFYRSGSQILLTHSVETRLLPGRVVNREVKKRADLLEMQQGFRPGRKQLRELKEIVTDELLPRAFPVRTDTRVWIDTENRWLAIDTTSAGKADEIRSLLFKTFDIGLEHIQLNEAPVAAMTSWLAGGEAPGGFTVDQDVELRGSTDEKATVRYSHHPLDGSDIRQHIEGGKRTTKLAMTWNDRISFVLTDTFAIKRVTPLDILKDAAAPTVEGAAERFEADFKLMTGELARLVSDLIAAVGGERAEADAA